MMYQTGDGNVIRLALEAFMLGRKFPSDVILSCYKTELVGVTH